METFESIFKSLIIRVTHCLIIEDIILVQLSNKALLNSLIMVQISL